MTFPSGGRDRDGRWLPLDGAERDAIGSREALQAGDVCRLTSDAGEYLCTAVTGLDSSTWDAEGTSAALTTWGDVLANPGGNTSGGTDVIVSDGDSLTVGEGGAGTKTLAIDTENASQGQLRYHTAGAIRWNAAKLATSDDYAIERYTGASVFQGAHFQIQNSDGLVLINSSSFAVGGDANIGRLLVAGATGDAGADFDDLIIGTLAAGNRGMSILGDSSSIATIAFTRVSGVARGHVRFLFASNSLGLGINGSDEVLLTTTTLRPNGDNGLALGLATSHGYTSLTIADNAAAPGNSAGRGSFWARDDDPDTAMFTDDAGNDRPLSKASIQVLRAADMEAGTAASAVLNNRTLMDFTTGVAEAAYIEFVLPNDYSGAGLAMAIGWAPLTAAAGNVVWEFSIERIEATLDLTGDSFDPTNPQITVAANGTANELQFDNLIFADVDLDGATPGDAIRVRIVRRGDLGGDTFGSDARIYAIRVVENI